MDIDNASSQTEQIPVEELAARLASMCSQTPDTLDAYLIMADDPIVLQSSQTTTRCHILRCEGNGVPRVNGLASLLARKVIDYAIPRAEIDAASELYEKTGTTSAFVGLTKKATRLFTHIKNSGEGGELLLYLLTEACLGIPQIISKMSLKTNSQVHYHGVDGIHASVDVESGLLALWWGESKLYKSFATGVSRCLDSIAQYLIPDVPDGSPVERDVDLLSSYADFKDPDLVDAFKRFMDPDDPHFNRVQYRGVCLVGFDQAQYPRLVSAEPEAFDSKVYESIAKWRAKIRTSVLDRSLDSIVLEVFFVPFPSVEALRQSFLRALGVNA